MEDAAVSQLQAAIVAACQEAFEHMVADQVRLEVTLTRFADRIEIALAHSGEASPAVGLDTIAGFAAKRGEGGASTLLAGVDRVQYETQGGEAVTRLTKYIGHVTPNI